MKQVQQGSLHIIVAGRLDGAVGFFYARDPLNMLAALGTHMQLGDVEVRSSSAAARVTERLRRRFAITHVPSDALPWYLIDYRQALEALDSIDLDTGELKVIAVDAPVMVDRRRGRVFGYTRAGDVVVRLDNPGADTNLIIANRQRVKPILRARTA